MPNAPVAAAAIGLPEPDFAAQIFPKAKLAAMSLRDLAQLSQLLWSVQGAVTQSAIINAPGQITPACETLQDFSSVVVCALSDIVSVAEAHRPANAAEARWRGWLLMNSASQFCDDLTNMAVTAARCAADERNAEPPCH